jgi:DNA-binding winged helix-turn-helix (wHTH) protein
MVRMQQIRCVAAPGAENPPPAAQADASGSVQAFGFGRFRLDLVREQLVGPAGRQVLRRQVFATLRLLLDTAPALVSLDELLDRVWGRHAISPSAVPHVIVELRRVLGDSARTPRYIETRHRRGYRMIPAVIRDLAPRAPQPTHPPAGSAYESLLDLIDESRVMAGQASPRQRLERLCQAASDRGLTLLALQAQLAMRSP